MTVDATLAAIDGALDDWGTSDDAMRWQPELARVICDGGALLWPERWSVWRHGDWSYRITAIGAAALPPVPAVSVEIHLDAEPFNQAIAAAGRALASFGKVCGSVTGSLTEFGETWVHSLADPRHRARCRRCNPAGNPLPLAIDGREYRRRQRARRRR